MDRLKSFIRSYLPFIIPVRRFVLGFILRMQPPDKTFTAIYRTNRWKDKDSRSGPGSNLSQTEAIRQALPVLLKGIQCASLLDIPCGDFYWMSKIDLDLQYIGADIVADIIATNRSIYARDNRRFVQLNIISDPLPKVDLIFCRDCLVHFSYAHIFTTIKNMKSSESTYLLTTTFTNRTNNIDIATGEWRTINLQRPPFNFPPPLQLIDEQCTEGNGAYADKALGLWKIADLPG